MVLWVDGRLRCFLSQFCKLQFELLNLERGFAVLAIAQRSMHACQALAELEG